MKLNEKILYYRKAAKLSQEELAARVGVSRQAVSKWELGDATPEVDKLLALARAFGVTTDELLSEGEPAGAREQTPPPRE
ncbi:MAG: helix-turn-helix domain-containing protein, partial [Oscillospiraceae bacterium]|nr:helix-turn-helix domain-containing protein [Oscillospiraceae bacterium]